MATPTIEVRGDTIIERVSFKSRGGLTATAFFITMPAPPKPKFDDEPEYEDEPPKSYSFSIKVVDKTGAESHMSGVCEFEDIARQQYEQAIKIARLVTGRTKA